MSTPNVNLDPAKSAIDKVGGVVRAAEITGKHISRVYRWMYPSSKGGTGGIIPHSEAMKLLEHAKENQIPLTAEDFMQTPSPAPEREGAE